MATKNAGSLAARFAQRMPAALKTTDPSAWVAGLASLAYVAAAFRGVPMLRQDWGTYPFRGTWEHVLSIGFSGWSPVGMGSPVPYPAFAVSLLISAATALTGNTGAFFLFLLGTGALCSFGARAVARDTAGGAFTASAAAIFAVLNPWTYTELIAGHLFMILAYGASIWILREILSPSPRYAVLATLALLVMSQMQFFVVCTILLVLMAAARKRWKIVPLLAVMWFPAVIGIVLNRAELGATVFTLAWERSQSLSMFDALQLNGYFAHYTDGLGAYFFVPTMSAAILSLLAIARPSWRIGCIAAGTLCAVLVAAGTRGPLGAPFAWSVAHIPIAGLFRELYDLIAFAAVGYLFLSVITCSRWRWAGLCWFFATLLLPLAWLVHPPAHFWVSAETLPQVNISGTRNTRFALVPAFQPMAANGRGSGSDPDGYSRRANVTPLNQYLATYPVNAALSAFLLHGEIRPLEALSTAIVVERQWLRTKTHTLAPQFALPFAGFPQPRESKTIRLRPAPELALQAMPAVGALDANIGAGNIFFGDAALVHGPLAPAAWHRFAPIVRIFAPNEEVRASRAWVDAGLAFAQRPAVAQALGGAITTNVTAQLGVKGGIPALVYVEGVMRSSLGRVLATTTHGYKWISIPAGTRRVICIGLCVVAAQGHPAGLPLNPKPRHAQGVSFRSLTPWLAIASLPSGPIGALRYNVAYNGGWAAFLGGESLTHLRLDGTINGWLVPARLAKERLVLIELSAALQLSAELVVLVVLFTVEARSLLRWMRARSLNS